MAPSFEEQQITLEKCNGNIFVLTLTGTPHKANVFSIPLIQRLDRLLDQVEGNMPCTLVIRGSGKFFSAGFDLQALTGTSHNGSSRNTKQGQASSSSSAPSSTLQGQDLVEQSWKVLARLLVFPAPTIALLNGHAFGLGLFLALACDHRIMIDNDDDSSIPSKGSPKLCLPEITIGLPLGSGFAALAKCKMPKDTLRTAALTGKQYQSQDALKAGIIDAILPSSSDEKAALPMQVVTMAANLVPTSAKGNLPAIKMELYGETYKELVTGKSQAKL